MNKRECIDYMVKELKKAWLEYSKPTDYDKRREVYTQCRKVCEDNGYTGGCYEEL